MADSDYIGTSFEDELNFIEVNAETILSRLVEKFQIYTGDVLNPADERRIFLQGLAYVLADEANHINETGRGNLLKYANGQEIDALGDLFQNSRLEAERATVEMQITFSESFSNDITVPAGTRVTADGIRMFALDEDVVLEARAEILTKTVKATATKAGADHNDFVIGQINRIVDTSPYVYTVSNTTTSIGGTDPEDDDSYKERLRLAPFTFAVAGPSESYRAIALSVSNRIADVHPYSPSAGVVDIVVVYQNGEIPNEDDELLQEILEACSDRNKRPLTDLVRVTPAEAVNVNIDVKYYIPNNDMSVVPSVMEAVEVYKKWQTEKIGRTINPDYLRTLMVMAGAARVEITAPVDMNLEEYQIAAIGTTNVTYAGSIKL